jgi:hypothetical protein
VVVVQGSSGLRCPGRREDAGANPQATKEGPPETKPGGRVAASVGSGVAVGDGYDISCRIACRVSDPRASAHSP